MECPVCFGFFDSYSLYLDHIRSIHGPTVFPYTCGICFTEPELDAPCYRRQIDFMNHWKSIHPNVERAEFVVHPQYGNHYSRLFFQFLYDFLVLDHMVLLDS